MIYPFNDPVALVCDEEALFKENNQCSRIIAGQPIMGTFFLCRLGVEDFISLSPDLLERYNQRFRLIERDP